MTPRRLALVSINLALAGALLSVIPLESARDSGTATRAGPTVEIDPEPTGSIEMVGAPFVSNDIGSALFRPAAKPIEKAETPADPMDVTRLLGVIQGRLNDVAILTRPTDASPIRLRLGADIDGWTVTEINRKSVTLKRGANHLVLRLDPADAFLPSGK